MVRRSLLAGLLIGALGPLSSACSVGVQQLVFSPAVGGQYTFSGTRVRVRSPEQATDGAFDLELAMDPRVGRIEELRAFPQIAIGLDTPRWRATINPGITGQDDLSHLQLDLFYKHPLLNSRHTALRLLAGLSYASLSVQVQEQSVISVDGQVEIEGAIVQSGDTLTYTHRASDSGVFVGGGLELELTTWLHLFATLHVRLNSSRDTTEGLELKVKSGSTFDQDGQREAETFELFEDDRFRTTILEAGEMGSTVELPPLVAMVGVAIVLPTWSWIERTFLGTQGPTPQHGTGTWGPAPPRALPPPARPAPPSAPLQPPDPRGQKPEEHPPSARPLPS